MRVFIANEAEDASAPVGGMITCCDDVMVTLGQIRDGVKERVMFANGGSLPAVAGHNWYDPAYALNNDPNNVYGTTPLTACYLRANAWRQWLAECDYWLENNNPGEPHLLYHAFPFAPTFRAWLNTDYYGDAFDMNHKSWPLTYYSQADYQIFMEFLTGDAWYMHAFNTVAGVTFTMGWEYGFGFIDHDIFGNYNPHVIVNNVAFMESFCDLMHYTCKLMLEAVQKLMAMPVIGGPINVELYPNAGTPDQVALGNLGPNDSKPGFDCDIILGCDGGVMGGAIGRWNTFASGVAAGWQTPSGPVNPPDVGQGPGVWVQSGKQYGPTYPIDPFDFCYIAWAVYAKGNMYIDASYFFAGAVSPLSMYAFEASHGGAPTGSPPFIPPDNLFHLIDTYTAPVHVTTTVFGGATPPVPGGCTGSLDGWAFGTAITPAIGNFTV